MAFLSCVILLLSPLILFFLLLYFLFPAPHVSHCFHHVCTCLQLHQLFRVAQEMKRSVKKYGCLDLLKVGISLPIFAITLCVSDCCSVSSPQGKVLGSMFYEVSTRTMCSFHSAMQRLGGSVVSMIKHTSSVMKGESLEGEVVTSLSCY